MQAEVQVEEREAYSEGFTRGFEAAKLLFGGICTLEDVESVKKLPAGSCIRDGRGKIHFRTRTNGWVSVARTYTSSMYLALPVEVLYHG